MPRTKAKPKQGTQPLPSDEQPSGEVLTLSEAALYLRITEAAVLRGVEEQALPARRMGSEWRFLKPAIRQWLAAGSPTWEKRKAAILELAGKYKDDPDLEQIVADAYQRRGRSLGKSDSAKSVDG